jgi:hypothetical protein
VQKQVKELEETESEVVLVTEDDHQPSKVREHTIQLPASYDSEKQNLLRRWRIAKRAELRESEQAKRRQRQWQRVAYSVLLGLIAIPVARAVMQFYDIPFTNIDPGPLVRRMWLPAEKLTVAAPGQPTVTVGYVLSTSDKWFVIITEPARTIEYVKSDSVLHRDVCAVDQYDESPQPPLVRLQGAQVNHSQPCSAP